MRKLGSIQKILNIEPIANADSIEKCTVLGWQLVVKKGDFKKGDLCVYCEIDSLMPDRPEFEFLKKQNMRIKTVRLRGQLSQGICFPCSILPLDLIIEEGLDCTELLGITKYDPPIPACLSGEAKGHLPSCIPKTDETRVQILQDLLDKYVGEKCYISEKLDGSSVTYYFNDGVFGACGRTIDFKESSNNTIWKYAKEADLENKIKLLGGNFAFQGEIVGEGIQKNTLKLKGQTVYFYNIFDITKYQFLSYDDFIKIIEKSGLKSVPIISNDYILGSDLVALVKMATIKSQINQSGWAEGIVIRSLIEKIDQNFLTHGGRMSFKVINPEYLLKYE